MNICGVLAGVISGFFSRLAWVLDILWNQFSGFYSGNDNDLFYTIT